MNDGACAGELLKLHYSFGRSPTSLAIGLPVSGPIAVPFSSSQPLIAVMATDVRFASVTVAVLHAVDDVLQGSQWQQLRIQGDDSP